jgi:hypothetical protein
VDHDWSGWEHNEPHPGDADTADLSDSEAGQGDLGHGYDFDHSSGYDSGLDHPGGFEPADEPGAHAHPEFSHEPDDAHDYGTPDYDAHDLGGHDLGGHDDYEYTPHTYAVDGDLAGGVTGHEADLGGHEIIDSHVEPDVHDVPDQFDEPGGEHLVGTDPDVDSHADDTGWYDHDFPPSLELEHVPEPVDGYPWSDPNVLGHEISESTGDLHSGYGAPPASDLFEYAGLDGHPDGDAWAHLYGSDDPATGALARWWGPS